MSSSITPPSTTLPSRTAGNPGSDLPRTRARLEWPDLQQAAWRAMLALHAANNGGEVPVSLLELIRLRVSQINGCAFCVDMHARALAEAGETAQRLASVVTWRETALYTEAERAALAWAEALTRLDRHPETEADFEALRAHFGDAAIVTLTATIAEINAWNRFGVGMAKPVVAIETS